MGSVDGPQYDPLISRTSVNNVVLVEEIDSKKNLLDSFSGILLGELALFADTVEKLAASSELCNNVELVLVDQNR
ncbi:unnamed protein product [Fusarium graminearum]|nr:unnamed protein product [Fusarium graminearum]CAG1965207.1 unnamed protein product [Fusarium graminearum]VTO85427.1 unnamed protein product [Fusarium graminearum]